MTQPQIHLGAKALDAFEVPVVRVNIGGDVTYANQAMLDLVGAATYEGTKVAEWLANFEDWDQVSTELLKRQRGEASTYSVEARRVSDGAKVPVSVYAVPEVDQAGKVTGSLAFVTNLQEKEVQRAMHEAIETQRGSAEILGKLDELLRPLIKYDNLRITAISRRRKHLRAVYSTVPNPGPPLRWWTMPPFVLNMIDDDQPKSIDVDELFSRKGAEEMNDASSRAFREQGYKHILSIPVKQGPRTVAFIGLDTMRDRPYTKSDIDLCLRLPLAEGALMALQYEASGQRELVIDLIQELTAAFGGEDHSTADPQTLSEQIQRAAEILVKRLAGYFAWEHVSIFRYDEESEHLRLLKQASHKSYGLEERYSISTQKGLIGKAFRQRRIVNVGDVRNRELAPEYELGVEGIISELCVPVPGKPTRWVVNIESKEENAFTEEEVSIVEMLVREAGNILERAALLEMRHAVLASVNDAVVETDSAGTIKRANRAAVQLLGIEDPVGKSMVDFIVNEDVKKAVRRSASFPRMEAWVARRSDAREEKVPIMISGAQLPPDLGGKVFVLSDVRYHRELRRMDLIKEVFRQAALETRIPLALAACYLAEPPRGGKWGHEAVQKILQQLRKADLPLERLLRLAGDTDEAHRLAAPVDLKELLGATLRELPSSDQIEIDLNDADSAVVRAPRESLAFCIESMLSFALRTRPPEMKITLELAQKSKWATLSVKGDWAPVIDTPRNGEISGRWRRKAIEDMTLASRVIGKLAKRSGGTFRSRLKGKLALDLRLPMTGRA